MWLPFKCTAWEDWRMSQPGMNSISLVIVFAILVRWWFYSNNLRILSRGNRTESGKWGKILTSISFSVVCKTIDFNVLSCLTNHYSISKSKYSLQRKKTVLQQFAFYNILPLLIRWNIMNVILSSISKFSPHFQAMDMEGFYWRGSF